ncbi:MAG: SDR family oxidoreductase [Chromatiales bacterium]|nr:SDR family oxidoreductase [Gammaproteobacteria bacterium]MBW6476073.1 SDR family oxidoreductase [Chromatiales bacterium]
MAHEIIIIGCGDVGTRLARRWRTAGVDVAALFRSALRSGDRQQQLQSQGIAILHADLDQPETLAPLQAPGLHGRVLYYLAPPPGEGERDSRIEHFLACLGKDNCPQQLIYMGTSGVYGDSGGAWVDEECPTQPQTGRAIRRLAAETALRQASQELGFSLTLLRVGGIYGPGRLPEARLRQGLPVLRETECGYSNRIHVDDLLGICIAAAEHPQPGQRVFNVSDGKPGNMTEYFLAVAQALGLPPPPQLSLAEARQQLSPAMLSYLGESRRMDSRKVLRELAYQLRYPDLASGLRDIEPGNTSD